MRHWVWSFLLLSVCAVENMSWGAPLPSDFLVRTFVAKRKPFKALDVSLRVTRIPAAGQSSDGAPSFHERVQWEPGQKQVRRLVTLGPESAMQKTSSMTPLWTILWDASPDRVIDAWIAWGIPIWTEDRLLRLKDETERRRVERVELTREQGKPRWKIGEPARGGQLWIERENFAPLHWSVREAVGSEDKVEYRLQGPKHIEVTSKAGSFRIDVIEKRELPVLKSLPAASKAPSAPEADQKALLEQYESLVYSIRP